MSDTFRVGPSDLMDQRGMGRLHEQHISCWAVEFYGLIKMIDKPLLFVRSDKLLMEDNEG